MYEFFLFFFFSLNAIMHIIVHAGTSTLYGFNSIDTIFSFNVNDHFKYALFICGSFRWCCCYYWCCWCCCWLKPIYLFTFAVAMILISNFLKIRSLNWSTNDQKIKNEKQKEISVNVSACAKINLITIIKIIDGIDCVVMGKWRKEPMIEP